MTSELMHEWQKHRSTFALSWLAAMRRRGKVITVVPDSGIRTLLAVAIQEAELPKKKRDALAKDTLLVVASWGTDRLVASRDDKVRRLLADLSPYVDGIGSLIWVNPDHTEEDVVAWLHAGARSEAHRRLDKYG